ncbi:MAG: CoA-binding protein [Chloroflexota bacterium]
MNKEIAEQFQPIFYPESVAVIGASSSLHKWGAQTIRRLKEAGYTGTILPINPRENVIQGLPAYHSLSDVPGKVDLAIITVPAEAVPQSMRECVQKGIKGAVVITADFAETGNHGQELQDEIVNIARQGGMRFVGPNCFGVWSATPKLNTLPTTPRKGGIGLISQSGSLSHVLARAAASRGYGMSKIVSIGNQADINVVDCLEYLANDPETEAIALYLEGYRDGRKLFQLAREMAAKKPVVVYKAGRNPGAARVALSHTASISGEDKIFDAMCRQVGFIRSYDVLGTMDMAGILTRQPLPKGNRMGIQGTGGQCMVLADGCLSAGMEIPVLKDEDISFIIAGIDFPSHAPAPRNPIDFGGGHTALKDATVLNRLAQLDYIDGIIANRPTTFHADSGGDSEKLDLEVGALLAEIPQKYGKPIVLISLTTITGDGKVAINKTMETALANAGIPHYASIEEAVRAMSTLMKYAEIRRKFA